MSDSTLTSSQIKRLEKALGSVPFAGLIGIELEEVGRGSATLAVNVRKELTQNRGVVHGGAIASLVDTATAFAIITLLAPRERVTTVDLTISYLRPVAKGRLRSRARVVRAGRRLFVVSAEVVAEDTTLLATALSTYIKV